MTKNGRWTTQQHFAAILVAMVVLILGASVVGAEALNRTSAVSNRLNDRISPARTAVVQLDDALRNQDTALRGYLLSGAPQFLDLYRESVTTEQTVAASLREFLAAEREPLTDLEGVEQAAATWRASVAEPAIRTRGGDVTASFEPVRARLTVLDDRLVLARQQGRAALADARELRDIVFLGLVAALLLLIVGIAILLRVTVVSPLTRLGAAVREVAGGDFAHAITPGGPADVAEVGRDVEAMRHRLVDALTTTGQARDVLEQREAELRRSHAELEQREVELRRSNADLEQFAYVASHDLQEPLRKVASFCQMLQRRYGDQLDDRAQQYIGFAVDGATRMQRLINDLLTFSRIGRLYDGSAPVDLGQVLDRVEETLAESIEETEARIVRPRLPVVAGDVTLLTMLWQNLLGNAIKFRRPDEAPHVEITATATGSEWTFSVSDHGIGIDPEFADKIFVIFQRLHSRERYEGTGIGLAICKKVVEHHGGTIELDSSYTQGARLVFTLPAGEAPVA
ncbi:histidine kinase [Actinoplanes cyaneus]|uniref:histidine kinase n=1 Tax=Actinoplanes cyaneus TaxID=52696 RepID=A0A919IRJ4_9ACTN|nr:ATP-binding protein [Actinoplanes cyaneus]MCW2143650.1 HAMP domain-containing protein [Actinoplanes cyaneus]GID69716.1 histidine kinase [Actinoplanes cyaneus]